MAVFKALALAGMIALLSGCGGGGESAPAPAAPQQPAPDTTPDAINFSSQTGAALSAEVTSPEIAVTGISAPTPVSITGGEYSIDGGTFTSAAGMVSNNQKLRVRVNTSPQFSAVSSVVLNVGGVSATFKVTTLEADATPAAFQFPRVQNAVRGAWVNSGSITVSEINVATPVSITNGEYAIAGGAFTSSPGTVTAGQTIVVRTHASAIYSRSTRATLTVGTVSSTFEVTSELPGYVPDAVAADGLDIIYLLSAVNRMVFRWSIGEERYLDAYALAATGPTPTLMTYSAAHQRLYLSYTNGNIEYFATNADAATATASAFGHTPLAVEGLAAVGNFLLAEDHTGPWVTHYIFNNSGVVTDQKPWNYYSREYAWDPSTSRVYFLRDDTSPNDLQFEVIDQSTGKITAAGETPYHGSYNINVPIRVSTTGQYVLLGSGDIYEKSGLTWAGSLGAAVVDARWAANNALITLSGNGGHAVLQRLAGAQLVPQEQVTYTGQALRVIGSDSKMAVLLVSGGALQIRTYVPNDDSDGDGVPNTQDAFPLDPAASVDSDGDGYPDAWNPGRSEPDSTTGLVLDAFAQDSACWLPAHGIGSTCNYAATIPSYVPDQIVQAGDIIYLLSAANHRIYRWSISQAAYLNPYVVGANSGFVTLAPTRMAFSAAHQRLYLGYTTGAIRYLDASAAHPIEQPFVAIAMAVDGLSAVGNFVLADDGSGGWGTHYIISAAGVITDQKDLTYYSREYVWDPVTSRVYFFRDGFSPNDLHYEVIDQASGRITAAGETPYHGSYLIEPPIRVSVDGQRILLGSGDLYSQNGLTWAGSLGGEVRDARWLANNSLVSLTTDGTQTTLRRLATGNLGVLELRTFVGEALRIVGSDAAMVVVVLRNGTVQFNSYVPNSDSDGDGVANTQDAFPLDSAASVDTDHDGHPDAWNAGKTQADSTTGLTLDSFPLDAACWLPAHGSGGNCNYAATVPNYVPDQVVSHGNIIYLLSSANQRVYRWSMSTRQYLNPYVVGINQGFGALEPTVMAISASHQRLYLGYQSGAIHYIDLTVSNPLEAAFSNTSQAVGGLASVGNYVMAQDYSGAWATHYVFDSGGTITDQKEWNYYSRDYAWDPVKSRVYFFRDDTSPDDLHYEVVDQGTGKITSAGETPYHGDYLYNPPIRVSPDGGTVLAGPGDLYASDGLLHTGSLGKNLADARYTSNMLVTLDTTDLVEIRKAGSGAVVASYQYLGQPLHLGFGQSEGILVHVMNGTTAFVRLPFYDQDGDTLPRWWETLYGLSDTNAADASGDLDADGLDNAAEYAHQSDPTVADTDGDGLTDNQEVVTWSTDPAHADTDGDGLRDGEEVLTHHTNPRNADSDGDGFTDLEEVLYGGDPNDVSTLPVPLTSYSQTFEGSPNLAAWTMPVGASAPWALSGATVHAGTASLKSGAITDHQYSTVRFHGYFSNGQLKFWARVDAENCCDVLAVKVDGAWITGINTNAQWTQYSVPITFGMHDIEWIYQKDYYNSGGADAAWIDDVTFGP